MLRVVRCRNGLIVQVETECVRTEQCLWGFLRTGWTWSLLIVIGRKIGVQSQVSNGAIRVGMTVAEQRWCRLLGRLKAQSMNSLSPTDRGCMKFKRTRLEIKKPVKQFIIAIADVGQAVVVGYRAVEADAPLRYAPSGTSHGVILFMHRQTTTIVVMIILMSSHFIHEYLETRTGRFVDGLRRRRGARCTGKRPGFTATLQSMRNSKCHQVCNFDAVRQTQA